MKASRFRDSAILGAGTLLWILAGWPLLRLTAPPNASSVWPLAGVAIGMLARFGYRFWPIVFAGSSITNFLVNSEQGVALSPAILSALGIALGQTAAALLGARLSRRALGMPPELDSGGAAARFILFTGFLTPAIATGCGVLSLFLAGILPAAGVPDTALTWFTGSATGILTCAPLFFIDSMRPSRWHWPPRVAAEWVFLLIVLVIVGQTLTGSHLPAGFSQWPKSYMLIPLVLWIAFRLGRRGAVVSVLLLKAIGIAGTMRGFAAFPSDSVGQSLLSLQLFIGVIAIIGLTVSALVYQVRRQREALVAAVADQTVRLAAVTQENAILTASAVHELQSPLSGMRNLLQLVRASPEVLAGPDGAGLLGEMQTSVERMFGLVTGALATSGPGGSAPADTAPVPCDLAALLHRAADAEQAHADSKRITIHRQVPAQSISVPTHAAILGHIVGNFLSNAVKFSAPGASIFLTLEAGEGGVKISVADEGPGIPERDRAGMFSGQFREHGARPTGDESSSGMGLYLASQLAERLGATVSCGMSPAGGSVFTVCLAPAAAG
jgi:signal transduction histidine kinase